MSGSESESEKTLKTEGLSLDLNKGDSSESSTDGSMITHPGNPDLDNLLSPATAFPEGMILELDDANSWMSVGGDNDSANAGGSQNAGAAASSAALQSTIDDGTEVEEFEIGSVSDSEIDFPDKEGQVEDLGEMGDKEKEKAEEGRKSGHVVVLMDDDSDEGEKEGQNVETGVDAEGKTDEKQKGEREDEGNEKEDLDKGDAVEEVKEEEVPKQGKETDGGEKHGKRGEIIKGTIKITRKQYAGNQGENQWLAVVGSDSDLEDADLKPGKHVKKPGQGKKGPHGCKPPPKETKDSDDSSENDMAQGDERTDSEDENSDGIAEASGGAGSSNQGGQRRDGDGAEDAVNFAQYMERAGIRRPDRINFQVRNRAYNGDDNQGGDEDVGYMSDKESERDGNGNNSVWKKFSNLSIIQEDDSQHQPSTSSGFSGDWVTGIELGRRRSMFHAGARAIGTPPPSPVYNPVRRPHPCIHNKLGEYEQFNMFNREQLQHLLESAKELAFLPFDEVSRDAMARPLAAARARLRELARMSNENDQNQGAMGVVAWEDSNIGVEEIERTEPGDNTPPANGFNEIVFVNAMVETLVELIYVFIILKMCHECWHQYGDGSDSGSRHLG